MLVAKPGLPTKLQEIANKVAAQNPEISVDSFFLPRDESCNRQWNIISTNVFGPILEWFVSVLAPSRGLSAEDPCARRLLLEEVLEEILTSPDYSVVVGDKRVSLTVEYLLERENWVSNATQIAIYQALTAQLGPQYADIDVVTAPNDPWLDMGRFVLASSTEGVGIIQKIARLKGGPRQVYIDAPIITAFFNRTKLYEVVEDTPIGRRRRRIIYRVYWTNHYYVVPEVVATNHTFFSYFPVLFSQHPILKRIPGFNLKPANVRFEFPDGDYSGTWEVTVDYDITPIDRVRSWFSVGELQETVATLSAEVLELQRDRKALSEEAERLAGQLIEAEKLAAVGRLSFGVGHDLRNTLATAINSGIPLRRLMVDLQQIMEMLEEGNPTEKTAEYMSRRKIPSRLANAPELYETMMNSLAQALDNVKALEGYAVQDGSDFQDVRIEDVIQRVLHDYQEELQDIQVETSFEEGEYVFMGNPLKLYDIFQNLVSNAIEAMEETEDPILRITTQISEGMHVTTVEDNGCGMSEEVRRHAFEPFYTTRGLAEGRQRGLGLFNVWRLVEQHSGTIEIESESGEYTRLHICFRIAT